MSLALDLVTPDLLRRQVLVAVACIDPFSGRRVSQGLEVTADGLIRKPIVNRSGYFVWRSEGNAGPGSFSVAAKTAPYQAMTVVAPFLPPLGVVGERLVSVTLRPAAGYPFPDAAVVMRGRLLQTAGGAAVTGARIGLQWQDDSGAWIEGRAEFLIAADGCFAVGLLIVPRVRQTANLPPPLVRLAATRAGITKATPAIRMVPGAQGPPPGAATPAGEIAWDALLPP